MKVFPTGLYLSNCWVIGLFEGAEESVEISVQVMSLYLAMTFN